MGPIQGVHPAPNAIPKRIEPCFPDGLCLKCIFFSRFNIFQKLNIKLRPRNMTIIPAAIFIYEVIPLSTTPMLLKKTPIKIKINVNPITKSTEFSRRSHLLFF